MVSGIAGAHDGGSRELGDRDVVWVAVSAFWAKGDNHVGPNASDVRGNFPYGNRSIYLVDGSVGVAQDGDITDTEYRGGGPQFRFTNAADFGRFGRSV